MVTARLIRLQDDEDGSGLLVLCIKVINVERIGEYPLLFRLQQGQDGKLYVHPDEVSMPLTAGTDYRFPVKATGPDVYFIAGAIEKS